MTPAGGPLSLDRLRRLQATLERRVAARDPENIRSVAFQPASDREIASAGAAHPGVVAQFDVWQKRREVAAQRRIEPVEPVRLLDREAGQYQVWPLPTQVVESGPIEPTGVRIALSDRHATTSVVARWSRHWPLPPREAKPAVDDHRWRWGVMTVAHLFVRGEIDRHADIERVIACGTDAVIGGRLTAAGRIPGGPDIALLETGYDRLQLSGFVAAADVAADDPADEAVLTRLISGGGTGLVVGDGSRSSCRWRAYYPSCTIESLGRLQSVVAVEGEEQQFVSGTSGSLLVVAGVPIGLQVGASTPRYEVGYFQCFLAALPFLRERVGAKAFELLAVL